MSQTLEFAKLLDEAARSATEIDQIDPNGKLAAEWRGIKIPGHARAVLESVPTA